MRFADADVLPYQFTDLADTVKKYADELKRLLKDQQDEANETNQRLDDGTYLATSDPRHPTVPPRRAEVPPFINFAPLDNALAMLSTSAEKYLKASSGLQKTDTGASLEALNRLLLESERRLTLAQGLPRRPWYKHQIYAPGWYTGYAPKTMPGVREAIEEKRYKEAEEQVLSVARVLQSEAELIDQATQEIGRIR